MLLRFILCFSGVSLISGTSGISGGSGAQKQ